MKLVNLILMSVAVSFAAVGCAATDDVADDTSESAQDLATARWERLGQTTVNGAIDHDAIVVGQDEGRFRSIQIQVDGSSLVMFQIKVIFGNGESFEPNVRWEFDNHTRSRVIDLPGDLRFIRRVEFRYANLPGGGNAHVTLFGRNVTPAPAWQELAESRVDGHSDHDAILVGANEGAFSAVQIRVRRSAMVMQDVKITFGNGEVFDPHVRLVFDANTTSRVIDLPGQRRFIKRVDYRYSDLAGGGDAVVQLWGAQ